MRRQLLYLYAAALLIAACSGDDAAGTSPTGSTEFIAFSASVVGEEQVMTRTPANAIETSENLKSDEGGFGVFACYTGLRKYIESSVSSDFMYNEKVTWNNGDEAWEYAPLKYWPNGEGDVDGTTGQLPHYVSFFAYAPYSNGQPDNAAGYCIPTYSHQGEPGNPWVTYRLHNNVADQVDLLCAEPLLDKTKPEKTERLKFQFNHALACVGDKVSISCSNAMKNELDLQVDGTEITKVRVELTKMEIVYTLTPKARLVLWNGGEPNWQLIFSEDPICTRTMTLVDGTTPIYVYEKEYNQEAATSNKEWSDIGIYYIPIEMGSYPQTAQVTVAYKKSTYSNGQWSENDAVIEGTVMLTLHDYTDAYKPGKHLYINIGIHDVSFTVTAAIKDWVNGGSKDVDAI